MRVLAKLLCLALFIAFVSCSGSSVPTVRDYTSGNPTRNVNPQSVVARCPPNQYPCIGGGGGGGDTIPPCDLQSQTVATVPANQARTTIGVGEQVTITSSDGGAISVTSGNSSTLSGSASPSTLTAGAQAGTATVTVAGTDSCKQHSLTFTIIAPTASYYNDNGSVAHDAGLADIGRYAAVWFGPATVNFESLWFQELTGAATGNGIWACNPAHTPRPAIQVSATYDATKGWKVGLDQNGVAPIAPCNTTPYDPSQYQNSAFTNTIPVQYSVNGGSWTSINTVTLQASDTNNGQLTISKDQMSGSTAVNNATSGWGNP